MKIFYMTLKFCAKFTRHKFKSSSCATLPTGALIYWYFKQSGAVLAETEKFANEISAVTRYPLDDDYTAVDAADYKDWAIYKLGVPSLTIEVGAENGDYFCPVPQSQFNASSLLSFGSKRK